jgi:phosphoenolpyruvate carboxykinase (GTP)
MAMLPFCGYNMSDYFAHWLRTGEREGAQLPRIFYVNWFLKDENGKFMWPGFGENSRVLAWMFRRCEGSAQAQETAIGLVPPVGEGGIETEGLDLPTETLERLLAVDVEVWKEQMPQMREHYARFGEALPASLRAQLEALAKRLGC